MNLSTHEMAFSRNWSWMVWLHIYLYSQYDTTKTVYRFFMKCCRADRQRCILHYRPNSLGCISRYLPNRLGCEQTILEVYAITYQQVWVVTYVVRTHTIHIYQTQLAKNTIELRWLEPLLWPWKFVRDCGSSSHGGLLLVPYQEA